MASFNRITVVGYLGKDPELRYTSDGTPVCSFSVATTEKWNDKGESKERTTWFKITLWRRQAEVANQYLVKGTQVFIEGSLHEEKWQDREGVERTTLAINGSNIQFLGKKDGDSPAKPSVTRTAKPTADDDLGELF